MPLLIGPSLTGRVPASANRSESGGAHEGAFDTKSASGGAGRGAFDKKSASGGAGRGAFDTKSASGGAHKGTFDQKSASGGVGLGVYDQKSASGGAALGVFDKKSASGGAALGAFDSRSCAGGAQYGAYNSKSSSGGASVSGIPIVIPGTTTSGGLQYGFFMKFPWSPQYGPNIMLVALGFSSSAYMYTGINSNAYITTSLQYTGGGGVWAGTTTYSNTISMNQWYYVTVTLGTSVGNLVMRQVIYQSGTLWNDSGQVNCGTALTTDTNLTAVFGLGQTVTPGVFTGWQNFINLAGNEMSKFWLRNGNPTGTAQGGSVQLPVPATDATISGMSPAPLIFYDCQQTVGTGTATLVDQTTNHYDATAGPFGLQILQDGPYP